MTTNWIEEFNNEFVMFNGQYIEPTFRDTSDVGPVIAFITTLLEKQREEYVEIVEEYAKGYGISQYNKEEIINLIKSHDKTS